MGWRHDFISKLRSDFRLPYVEMRLNAADNLTNVARNHVLCTIGSTNAAMADSIDIGSHCVTRQGDRCAGFNFAGTFKVMRVNLAATFPDSRAFDTKLQCICTTRLYTVLRWRLACAARRRVRCSIP